MVSGMFSSAECRAKAAAAAATAATLTDATLRDLFEDLAHEWAGLAVTALAHEVHEAEHIGQ